MPVITAATTNPGGGSLQVHEVVGLAYDVMRPDSVVGPAREGVTLRVVPTNYDYQPIWSNATTQTGGGTALLNPYVLSPDGTTVGPAPNPGFCPGSVMLYSARGLDASASLTVTVRTCIEYLVDGTNSAISTFLGPSPPSNPKAIQAVQDRARTIPAATWLDYGMGALRIGSALAQTYATGNPRPILALANH